MNHYIAAGNIFSTNKHTLIGYNLILIALEKDEYNSDIWHNLALALHSHTLATSGPDLISTTVACLKRSVQLNPHNKIPQDTISNLKKHDLWRKLIEHVPIAEYDKVTELKTPLSGDMVLDAYKEISNEDDKIALPMHLGETKNPLFFELLRHCILEETNRHVHYAALKRIHFYKDTHDLQPIFKVIVERGVKEYEPYFSMALSSIDTKWSKELLKQHSKADFFSEEKASNINSESNGDADDMIKSIFAISLSKYKPEELNQLYRQRNSKILGFYLINQLNDEGIRIILSNNVLDKTGFFTEKGWNYMKEFLESYTPTGNHPNDNDTDTKKAWWKLW